MIEAYLGEIGTLGVGFLIFYALMRIERKLDNMHDYIIRLNGGKKT